MKFLEERVLYSQKELEFNFKTREEFKKLKIIIKN